MKNLLKLSCVFVLGAASYQLVSFLATRNVSPLTVVRPKFVDLAVGKKEEARTVTLTSSVRDSADEKKPAEEALTFDFGESIESKPAAKSQQAAKEIFDLGDVALSEPTLQEDGLSPPKRRAQPLEESFKSEQPNPFEFDADAPRKFLKSSSKDSERIATDGIESLADLAATDEQKEKLTTLRSKLAELIKAKAELINEQALADEIEAAEKNISDLHAAQKLRNAQQILKSLIEEFPNSPAAQKATQMLNVIGAYPTPANAPTKIPQPIPAR